jgi:hypothetical protein
MHDTSWKSNLRQTFFFVFSSGVIKFIDPQTNPNPSGHVEALLFGDVCGMSPWGPGSHWIDQEVSDPAMAQLVILGAGLDTRAYRLPKLNLGEAPNLGWSSVV